MIKFSKLFFIVIFILFSVSNLFSNYSDKDIYIKIKKTTNVGELNKKLFENFNIKLEESILPYHLSLTYRKMLSSNSNFANDKNHVLLAEDPLLRTYRINIGDNKKIRKILDALKNYDEIEYSEKVEIPKLLGKSDYNDPYLNQQAVLDDIRAFDAYDIEDGDSTIIIGISDSGVDQLHEDINPNLFRFTNEIPDNNIDDDGNGYIDDYEGVNFQNQSNNSGGGDTYSTNSHGIKVSGIAGAKPNNNKGIMGVGNKCKIFPLKITVESGGETGVIYGYESIIYAGLNNFDVLNCSWGSEKIYSPIEQSIIDYAISRGVVLVVSAGNKETSNNEADARVKDWYPASYYGVIGVGSTVGNNTPFNSFVLHPQVDIMVRGESNYTTFPNNQYKNQGISGTSFASPVISGAVGIIKSRFPELNPYQIEQIVKRNGFNLAEFNPLWDKVIPKYFNLYDAINTNLNNFFSLTKTNHRYYINENDSIFRFRKGDEVYLDITLKNYFSKFTGKVDFTLSIAKEFDEGYVSILNTELSKNDFENNEEYTLSGFKFKINENLYSRVVFRVDYTYQGKRDFILVPFDNQPSMTHFENDEVLISLSNDGKIGYSNIYKSEGYGFLDKVLGNVIETAGFIGMYDGDKTFSGYSGFSSNSTDLREIKSFSKDNNEAEYSVNSSDITFTNKVSLNQNSDYPWVKFDININADSDKSSFAFGISGDVDLGVVGNGYSNNETEYFEDADFSDGELVSATQIAFYEEEEIYFGITAFSKEVDAVPQAAGLISDSAYSIIPHVIINALSRGTQRQVAATTDIGFASGINFTNGLKGSSKECSFCLAMAKSKDELKENLKNCVLGTKTSVFSDNDVKSIRYEQSKVIFSEIEDSKYSLLIMDLEGKVVLSSEEILIKNNSEIKIDLKNGLYFLSLYNNSKNYNFKFIVVK